MKCGLTAVVLALAACSSSSPTSDPHAEFESRWTALAAVDFGRGRSLFWWKPREAQDLLAVADTSPHLFDLLLDRLLAQEKDPSLIFEIESTQGCALDMDYIHSLVDRCLVSTDPRPRTTLLRAILRHSRHGHGESGAGESYASSVPARLESMTPGLEVGDQWILASILCAHYDQYREARVLVWSRIEEEERAWRPLADPLHLDALLRAVPRMPPEIREEVFSRTRELLLRACGTKGPSLADRALRDPVKHLLGRLEPLEAALFGSAFAEIITRGADLDYRFHALDALAWVSPEQVPRLLDALLGDRPTDAMMSRAFHALMDHPSVLLPVVKSTPPAKVRREFAAHYGRYQCVCRGGERERGVLQLISWLKEDADEEVRAAALRRLTCVLADQVRDGEKSLADFAGRAIGLLDTVLADPSVVVRRAALNELEAYSELAEVLDAGTREKIQRLVKSVPPGKP